MEAQASAEVLAGNVFAANIGVATGAAPLCSLPEPLLNSALLLVAKRLHGALLSQLPNTLRPQGYSAPSSGSSVDISGFSESVGGPSLSQSNPPTGVMVYGPHVSPARAGGK